MQVWHQLFPKNPFLNIFIWIAYWLLPLYFISRFFSLTEVIVGFLLIVLFFTAYRLSFIKQGWLVYVAVGMKMAISIGMIIQFGYVYLSLFLAFFIGNITHKAGFITVYIVNLVTTIIALTISFFTQNEMFISQFAFIIIAVIGVILLPFNMYNSNKQEKLEHQLQDANNIIAHLLVVEERQRIARDLHDTLGQKISLIGLKSDLAQKLIQVDPTKATAELEDIQQTARTALKEIRDLVSNMKWLRLADEVIQVQKFLKVANIDFQFKESGEIANIPLYIEHVLSMCLKEAVTNVIRHSQASKCRVSIRELDDKWKIKITDNGVGFAKKTRVQSGHGLQGMRERLEFVNGTLEIGHQDGTTLTIQVPQIKEKIEREGLE